MRPFCLVFLPFFVFPLSLWTQGAQAAPGLPTPFLDGAFRALVIGNNDYKDPQGIWEPLNTAVSDAEAVAKALRQEYGFGQVRLLKNATRRETIQAFNDLADEVRDADSVVIYYAGHGYLNQETREGFWIPVDAEGRDDSTFIPNAVVKTKLTVIAGQARHVLLVSDSCFSGVLLRRGNRGIRLDQKTSAYYRKAARRKSVQILAAGGLEFVDDDYRGTGHSPFTYYLLEELKLNTARFLEATDLSGNVARNVANNVQQTPVKGILYGAGHAGGEFFFVRAEPPPPVGAPKPAVAPATAAGPKEGPKAALPLLPPAVVTAAAAPPSGGVSLGLLTGSGVSGLVAVQQFLEARDLDSQAKDTAQSDPQRSAKLEADRDEATTNALIAGLVSAGLLVWALWGGDDESESTARSSGWQLLPILAGHEGGIVPGVMAQHAW